jgi:hypothetical protein
MPADCLILKIEEVCDTEEKVIDNEVFVLFDKNTERYIIRGKRNETYSFLSKTSDDVLNFLSFIIDNNNMLNYRLYNNKNLPWESDDITFDQLTEALNSVNSEELVSYDNDNFSKKTLHKRISILRYVYNYY